MDTAQRQPEPDIRFPRDQAVRLADLLVGTTWPQAAPKFDFATDAGLSEDLQNIIKSSKDFATLDVAAIDFSGARPRVGLASGARAPKHPATTFIASMAKLAVLYAAFQTRQDLRAVVDKDRRTTADKKGSYWQLGVDDRLAKLKSDLGAYWVQNSRHLGLPEKASQPKGAKIGERSDIGRIERMFDLGELGKAAPDPAKIDFVGIARCGLGRGFIFTSDTQSLMHELDDLRQSEDDDATALQIWQRAFAERLWMMAAWSSNV